MHSNKGGGGRSENKYYPFTNIDRVSVNAYLVVNDTHFKSPSLNIYLQPMRATHRAYLHTLDCFETPSSAILCVRHPPSVVCLSECSHCNHPVKSTECQSIVIRQTSGHSWYSKISVGGPTPQWFLVLSRSTRDLLGIPSSNSRFC